MLNAPRTSSHFSSLKVGAGLVMIRNNLPHLNQLSAVQSQATLHKVDYERFPP